MQKREDKNHLVLLSMLMCISSIAVAQRGQETNTVQLLPERPSTGIPGFFDTSVAQKGKLSFEIPTFTIDYGITDRLTLGINGISALNTIISYSAKPTPSSINLYLKTRYLLFTANNWSSAVTGYLFKLNEVASDTGSMASIKLFASSLNLSKIQNSHHFGISIAASGLNVSESNDYKINNSTADLNISIFSAWWRLKFYEALESELLASICPSPSAAGSQATGVISISMASCYGQSELSPLLRALIHWRSSESWLWTVGYISLPTDSKVEFPYLGFNYVWEIADKK